MVNYKELKFYTKSYELSLEIYKIEFPKDETYGLRSQIRRSSSSVPHNIAEGSGRGTLKSFKAFLYNALGSARETEVQLEMCKDLNYISIELYSRLKKMMDEVIGLMIGYMKTIKTDSSYGMGEVVN